MSSENNPVLGLNGYACPNCGKGLRACTCFSMSLVGSIYKQPFIAKDVKFYLTTANQFLDNNQKKQLAELLLACTEPVKKTTEPAESTTEPDKQAIDFASWLGCNYDNVGDHGWMDCFNDCALYTTEELFEKWKETTK